MKIIRPARAFNIARVARLATRKAPVRLASITLVNDSSLIRMSSPSSVTPALDTSTCTGPCFSSTSVKAASTAAASVTSQRTGRNSPGRPSVGPRWVTATWSPAAANAVAMASPIPRLPPVTSTLRVTRAPYGRSGEPTAQPDARADPDHQHQRAAREPRPAGVDLAHLVADLLAELGVDLAQLRLAGRREELAARQLRDAPHGLVVDRDRHRRLVRVQLDRAVVGAEGDRRHRHVHLGRLARRGERPAGLIFRARAARHGLAAIGHQHDAGGRRP